MPIHTYPDKCLRNKAQPVTVFDDDLARLTQNMAKTMYEAPGIGLAAPQVNILRRVVVIDVSEDKNDLRVLINHKLLTKKVSRNTKKAVYRYQACLVWLNVRP